MTSTWKFQRFGTDESGVASVAGVYLLLAVLMIGGLAIDYSNAVNTRAQMQAVADSAALAGARHLRDGPEAIRDAVLTHASIHGHSYLRPEDVLIGKWVDGQFTADETVSDAVAVITRRARQNDNPVMTYLLKLAGIDSFDVSALSVAATPNRQALLWRRCSGGGFMAMGEVDGHSSNDYVDGFCIHGDAAIRMHNNNHFEYGTRITLPDLAYVFEHRNNHGIHEAISAGTHDFARVKALPDLFERIEYAGAWGDLLPPQIVGGPIFLDRIRQNEKLVRGMLYVVEGDVELRGDRVFENIAIYAKGDIDVQSNVVMNDVVLAAAGNIFVASNVDINTESYLEIGSSAYYFCERGVYSSYLLSLGDIVFNSNIDLRGTFALAQGNITFNSTIGTSHGVYMEAMGDISYNSSSIFRGCGDPLETEIDFRHPETSTVQLVR